MTYIEEALAGQLLATDCAEHLVGLPANLRIEFSQTQFCHREDGAGDTWSKHLVVKGMPQSLHRVSAVKAVLYFDAHSVPEIFSFNDVLVYHIISS